MKRGLMSVSNPLFVHTTIRGGHQGIRCKGALLATLKDSRDGGIPAVSIQNLKPEEIVTTLAYLLNACDRVDPKLVDSAISIRDSGVIPLEA